MLLFMAFALMLALPAMALADNVQNDIETTAGADSNVDATVGNAVSVGYYINATGGSCDAADGSSVTLTPVKTSGPGNVAISPASKSLSACDAGTKASFGFTADAAGEYVINVDAADTKGTYNPTPAKFKLTVTGASAPPAPTDTDGDGVADGSDNCPNTANANQNDADGDGTGDVCDSDRDGDGVDNTTDNCADQANPGQADADNDGVGDVCDPDSTPPVISKVVTGTLGSNGWYTSNVSVDWTVSDDGSAISSQDGCDDFDVTSDQQATTYTCTATSGGGTDSQSVTIKRDGTAPVITLGPASGTAGDNGWYKSAVSQAFGASDATSGLANPAQDSFSQSSDAQQGSNVSIGSGSVSDNAGNTASRSAGPFKIDLNAPVANCESAPSAWSAADVSINCQPTDAVSGLANAAADGDFNLSTNVPNGTETSNASTGSRDVADAAGHTVTAGPISGIKVDKKAPALVSDGATALPDGDNGWYKSAVTNGFTATDGGSGFAPNGALGHSFNESSGSREGSAVAIFSGAVSDAVGNSNAGINSDPYKIDLSDPTNIQFVGGPAAGGSHDFGSVPAQPTCTADDAVSGLKSCAVTGYSTAVGTHTLTATATDNAGRTATATRTYTVAAWTLKGFYSPVDYGTITNNTGSVWNTVKGGSTVPLKFEVFNTVSGTELTNTDIVNQPLKTTKISCTTGASDEIELTSTGSTSLRYDSTSGQFIYNWQTPKAPGTCYGVSATMMDGSSIPIAKFQLK
ncbi:MAG: thrombospondin type 3 repeat-containing protein [Actinomycetota bacterium]|nr:thrombospondin type 3 repeat-containing protein [Actinomycetota bacterium]